MVSKMTLSYQEVRHLFVETRGTVIDKILAIVYWLLYTMFSTVVMKFLDLNKLIFIRRTVPYFSLCISLDKMSRNTKLN